MKPRAVPIVILLSCLCLPISAKKPAIDLDTQIRALLDALCHCQVSGPSGKAFVIAIVHHNEVSDQTVSAAKATFDRHNKTKIGGKNISTVVVPFESRDDLTKKLRLIRARAVFITENNEKIVREVLSSTRELKIVSMSNVPDYVHWLGVTLGVESAGRKPKLMINLASCQHEKVKFDEEILANASVYF